MLQTQQCIAILSTLFKYDAFQKREERASMYP